MLLLLDDQPEQLLNASRMENGIQLTWENFNPSKFALKTHSGILLVIGADGIIYSEYEILDMAPVPLTPPNGKVEWTSEVNFPEEFKDFLCAPQSGIPQNLHFCQLCTGYPGPMIGPN